MSNVTTERSDSRCDRFRAGVAVSANLSPACRHPALVTSGHFSSASTTSSCSALTLFRVRGTCGSATSSAWGRCRPGQSPAPAPPASNAGYVNYYLVPVPPGVDPGSLERTLEAFAVGARSACPLVENVLLIATQVEGLSWYFVTTTATSQWLHDGVGSVLWVAFFLNAAMVFGGFVRGLEGSTLFAWRTLARYRQE